MRSAILLVAPTCRLPIEMKGVAANADRLVTNVPAVNADVPAVNADVSAVNADVSAANPDVPSAEQLHIGVVVVPTAPPPFVAFSAAA